MFNTTKMNLPVKPLEEKAMDYGLPLILLFRVTTILTSIFPHFFHRQVYTRLLPKIFILLTAHSSWWVLLPDLDSSRWANSFPACRAACFQNASTKAGTGLDAVARNGEATNESRSSREINRQRKDGNRNCEEDRLNTGRERGLVSAAIPESKPPPPESTQTSMISLV